jgi:hypothetical protein
MTHFGKIEFILLLLSFFRLFVHARESQGSGVLRLKLRGNTLKNVEGLFSKSDPFFELSRKIDAAGGQTWYVHTYIHSYYIQEGLEGEMQTSL